MLLTIHEFLIKVSQLKFMFKITENIKYELRKFCVWEEKENHFLNCKSKKADKYFCYLKQLKVIP